MSAEGVAETIFLKFILFNNYPQTNQINFHFFSLKPIWAIITSLFASRVAECGAASGSKFGHDSCVWATSLIFGESWEGVAEDPSLGS